MIPIGNENREIVVQRKQKYIVTDVKTRKDGIREVLAVALPSSEVGIKRYQKEGEEDKGFSKEKSEKLYKDSRFKKLQESYEIELGKYAYKHPKAKQGVQTALNKAAEIYKKHI